MCYQYEYSGVPPENLTTLKIKKLTENAEIPKYAYSGDACIDLTATSKIHERGNRIIYGTGLSLEIPKNHVGLLFPRSSVHKTGMILANCVGVIDSNYRGEVKVIYNTTLSNQFYDIGDRVAQLMILPVPNIEILEVSELSDSDRGEKGFGSSGK